MARLQSQALGGYFKTQDAVRPLIYRRFAVVDPATDQQHYAVVDPCAGDGEAVCELVQAIFGDKKTWPPRCYSVYGDDKKTFSFDVFMIELEKERHEGCERRCWGLGHDIATTLHGDGLCCDCTGAGASLLWLNPPYDFFRGERFETRFLRKWAPHVVAGGTLIFIVPEYALEYLSADITSWFDDVEVLRYPANEYAAFKQVVIVATKRSLQRGEVVALPSVDELTTPPAILRQLPPGDLKVTVNAVDVRGILSNVPPWSGVPSQSRPAMPHKVGLAMLPKPAHVAMALGSGIFNGVRLTAPGKPDLLAKIVFIRDFVDVKAEEKKDERGEVVKRVQVEKPRLTLTTLSLEDGTYSVLDAGTTPSGDNEIKNFADLLLIYGDSMVAAMRERCPALHDQEHDVVLPAMSRALFSAQHHAVVAALKLLAHGETPLILGEIGSGKSSCALAILWSLARQNVGNVQKQVVAVDSKDLDAFPDAVPLRSVSRALVVCPPHLVQNWIEEARICLPDVPVHELHSVSDVDKFAAMADVPLRIAVLSRETMKLGHGVAGADNSVKLKDKAGKVFARKAYCPTCGLSHTTPPDKLASSRAVCAGEVVEPLDAVARVAHAMWRLRLRDAAWNTDKFKSVRRLATSPLLRRLWLGTTRLKNTWESKRTKLCWEEEKELIAAFKLVDADPRVLRCLKASKIDGIQLKNFAHVVDDATLCATLVKWGKWRRRPCGEVLYQAVPSPRRYPLADYITRKHRGLFQAIVPDECFVAGTKIGDVSIENIKIGDIVDSFDIQLGHVTRRVRKLFKSQPKSLVRVLFSSGQSFICTPNHPIWTTRGWCPAVSALCAEVLPYTHVPCAQSTWVDHVEVLEPGSDGKYGGLCPDGFVYNFEVEGTHTYFANGVLVHNCHEYSNGGTAQEIALHRLTECIRYVIPLTGSLMNGYAKSLFYNLWSISRRMRAEFSRKDAGLFVKLYGYQKRVLTGDAAKEAKVTERGASSDRVVKTEGGERLSDALGVLPSFVLRHILPLSITLHKRDINPDERVVDHDRVEVACDGDGDDELLSNGAYLGSRLVAAVKKDKFDEKLAGKLFGQLAEYPSYFDRATADTGNVGDAGMRSYQIAYPADVGGGVVAAAQGFDAAKLLPKERWLRQIVQRELGEDRRIIIALWHKDLAARLCRIAEDAAGERVAFLDADKVPARKRQQWIDDNVVGKRRILITNPSCVQTGLNNLIWFCTGIFHENPSCNPFISRQFIGRLDRITQRKEVRIYWPVYPGVQAKVLDLLQTKSAISQQIDSIDPTAALEMAGGGGGGGEVQSLDVGLAIYKYLGGD